MATPSETPKKGPRKTCPACGSVEVSDPIYCAPSNRAFLGLMRFLSDFSTSPWCEKEGRHLHQRCKVCNCAWTGTPVALEDK
jgi:hypothetical protein